MKYYGLLILISILIFAGAFYFGTKNPAGVVDVAVKTIENTIIPPKPCEVPLRYSLGSFDDRFGISREKFLQAIALAENVWDKKAGKKLFIYSTTTSDFSVNLLYDNRQQTTKILQGRKNDIGTDEAIYQSLAAKYDTLKTSYETQKAAFGKLAADVHAKQTDYNAQVAYWNREGGAPDDEYAKLEQQRIDLNSAITSLNEAQDSLNSSGRQLNDLVAKLNIAAQSVNAKVKTYNTVAMQGGEEFNEGEYIRDEQGARINIYQFETKEKLLRVLEHELGHALGMNHVLDPQGIMYRLNNGTGTALTKDDVRELNRVCGKIPEEK